MASDKTRALVAFAKVVVALAAAYAIYAVWSETRVGLDEWYVPYAAGAVVAVMVFFLLSKFNKSSE